MCDVEFEEAANGDGHDDGHQMLRQARERSSQRRVSESWSMRDDGTARGPNLVIVYVFFLRTWDSEVSRARSCRWVKDRETSWRPT